MGFYKYNLIGIFRNTEDLLIFPNLPTLASMEQLIFTLLKDSDAAPATSVSVAPAAACGVHLEDTQLGVSVTDCWLWSAASLGKHRLSFSCF